MKQEITKIKHNILFIDLLRIIATIGVIVIHVTAEAIEKIAPNPFWVITNTYNSLVQFSVPLFVMISGYLLLGRKNGLSIATIMKKYVLKIVICLLVWGIFYDMFLHEQYNLMGVWNGFINIITGVSYSHLWYLYMLIGLYFITPMVKILTDHMTQKQFLYFLGMWFLISSIVPYFDQTGLNHVTKLLGLNFFMGYIGFYMVGAYLAHFELSKKIRFILYSLGIVGLFASSVVSTVLSLQSGSLFTAVCSVFSPTCILFTITIFVFFQTVFKNKTSPKLISFISELCFGIYLVHFWIEKLLLSHQIDTYMMNAIISIPFIVVFIFVISACISWILSKIPILKRLR